MFILLKNLFQGKLIQESKNYKRIVKYKQKLVIDNLFEQLKSMHGSDPKQYINLVNSLRSGKFDSDSDIEANPPDEWFNTFHHYWGVE